MKSFAYPYPNLFPFIDISSTWKFAVGESEYQDFKNFVIDWDYDAILKIYFKPLWNIEEIFKQANLEEIFDNSKIAFILISGPDNMVFLERKLLITHYLLEILKTLLILKLIVNYRQKI